MVVLGLGAAPAAADKVTFSQSGCSTWTVPNGVTSVAMDAIGASGAAGTGSTAGKGGPGAEVTGTVSVTHGQAMDVCVGVGGGQGPSGGGNGGGASGVSIASDFSHPVVVAGGGGGGGASGSLAGGNGGKAGSAGSSGGGSAGGLEGGSPTTSSGPGEGAAGTGSGGGGGGGYVGGGGGSGSGLGGGGGAGGTNDCTASGCSFATASVASGVALTYTVASAPTTSIAAPANGAVYSQNQPVASSFSCAPGSSGSVISSCTDQNGQPAGAAIDTSTAGTHTFTVTARSSDGLSSSSSVSYTVAAAPRIWLPLPANGATYTVGQVVHSFFECADGAGGPGLESCADQNGRPSDAAVDTSTPGTRTFTVTATSRDGLTTSASIRYQVIPQPTVANVRARRGGAVTLQVTVYGAGAVDAISTASFRSFARAADTTNAIPPPLGSFVFGSAHLTATAAQTLSMRVGLSRAGRLLLRDHRRAALTLLVFYTTPRGLPQLLESQALRVSR